MGGSSGRVPHLAAGAAQEVIGAKSLQSDRCPRSDQFTQVSVAKFLGLPLINNLLLLVDIELVLQKVMEQCSRRR